MRIDWSTLLLQAANFLVLVWLLQHFLYRPVLGIIAERQQRTEAVIAEAGAARTAAEALRSDLEQQRSALATERDQALEQAHAAARADARRLLDEARADAGKLLAEQRRRLAQERAETAEALRRQTIELALTVARRLLAGAAAPGLDGPFLDRLVGRLQSLGEPERRELVGQLADGAALRLITAGPLAAGAREALRTELQTALGADPALEFAEDRALIAGAELHFPHTILRHSWRDSLAEIEAELKDHGGPEAPA